MIYVTGDCHGEFQKLGSKRFPEGSTLTKEDFVIICGDFGGVWCSETDFVRKKTEDYWIRWLNEKPFTTLFVDGNHENHERLNQMPVSEWHGGRVHKLADSVMHLMRGELFEIGGRRVFAFGGASSHDIYDGIIDGSDPDWKRQCLLYELTGKRMYRVKGLSWWEEELPSEEEMQHGLENLAKCDHKVDLIVSHCTSTSIQEMYLHTDCIPDRLTDYFEELRQNVQYEKWFFGHYHDDKQVTERDILLYDEIIRV